MYMFALICTLQIYYTDQLTQLSIICCLQRLIDFCSDGEHVRKQTDKKDQT